MPKSTNIVLALTVSVVFVFGCAAPSKNMINPQTLNQVRCSSMGIGLVGAPVAAASYSNCVNKFEVAGYIDMEEFEKSEKPKVEKASGKIIPAAKPVWNVNEKWVYKVPNSDILETVLVKGKAAVEGQPAYVLNYSNNKNDKVTQVYISENIDLMKRIATDNTHVWTPPLKEYEWPLEVNRAWNAKSTMRNSKGAIDTSYNIEVKDYGKVTVPAGTFDVFYVIAKNDHGLRLYELWYAPEIQNAVKKVVYGHATVKTELQEFSGGK